MKEIFFISSHPKNDIQKEYLRNLVNKIHDSGKKVIVAAHVPIPQDIADKCEYTFYSKNNELLTDGLYKGYLSVTRQDFSVMSKNFFGYNSILAIYHLVFPSLIVCKIEGYDVVHMLEYDTHIDDFTEFDANTSLLQSGDDIVIYNKSDDGFFMSGEFISFNMNSYQISDFVFSDDYLKTHIRNHPTGEDSSYNLFIKQKKTYTKHINNMIGVKVGLYHTDPSPITALFIDKSNDDVFVFSYNQSNETSLLTVVYGDKSINQNIPVEKWVYVLLGSLVDIKEVDIYLNKKLLKTYPLVEEKDINDAKWENIVDRIIYDKSKIINSNIVL